MLPISIRLNLICSIDVKFYRQTDNGEKKCPPDLSMWGIRNKVPCFGAYNTHIFSSLNNFRLGTACYKLQ